MTQYAIYLIHHKSIQSHDADETDLRLVAGDLGKDFRSAFPCSDFLDFLLVPIASIDGCSLKSGMLSSDGGLNTVWPGGDLTDGIWFLFCCTGTTFDLSLVFATTSLRE